MAAASEGMRPVTRQMSSGHRVDSDAVAPVMAGTSAGSSPVRTAAFVCSQLRCHGLIDVFVNVASTDAVEDAIAR